MGQFDNDRTVVTIKNRMKRLGVDLDRYVGQITNKWDSTPAGFGFTCKDKNAYIALMGALIQNIHFGSDNMIGGNRHYGASFREVSRFDSLALIINPPKTECRGR